MSIEKLERVMWRLRAMTKSQRQPTRGELRIAIMKEVGTSPTCITENIRALKALKWIVMRKGTSLRLTGLDLNEN